MNNYKLCHNFARPSNHFHLLVRIKFFWSVLHHVFSTYQPQTKFWRRLFHGKFLFTFLINSDPNLNPYSKTNAKPNPKPNSNLNLNATKANKKCADECFLFLFYFFFLKIFGEIVTSRTSRIERNVSNCNSAPLRCFSAHSHSVAHAQWHGFGPSKLVPRFGVLHSD